MAQVSGTFSTYDAIGNREDLEDVIYNITPTETPLLSMIGSTKVTATRHDWQTDALATPSASNAQIEGDDYSFTAPAATTRVSNMTQISRKEVIITDTQNAVNSAGRDREIAYQMSKRSVELKKDIEASMLSNTASVVGNDTTARVSAGLAAWLTTNDSRGASGADGGWNGTTVAAATNGTQRAFTKALLDTVIRATYVAGGNPSIVMVSPYNKQVFSSFMSDTNVAAFRYAADKGKNAIIASADIYQSDFGELAVVPNRVMSTNATLARNVFVITPDMLSRGVLRPVQQEEPAKTGDATKKVIKTEWTLIVKNEAAHGIIADVFGLTAAS